MNKYADLYDNAPACPKCSKQMTYVYGGDRTEIGPLCLECRCDKESNDLSSYWATFDKPGSPPPHPILLVVDHPASVRMIDTENW